MHLFNIGFKNKNVRENISLYEIDYDDYEMSFREYMMGFWIGFCIFFLASYIFYGHIILSLIISICFGIRYVGIYKNILIKKRKKALILEFKDFLEALASSYSSGMNTTVAFIDSLKDMENIYTERSYIVLELKRIVYGMKNGKKISDMLLNFAERSSEEDIKNFANIFDISEKNGSNMRDVIYETKSIINQKIETELEIETILAEKKSELYIMIVLPFIIVLALNGLGDEAFSAKLPINIIIRSFVLGIIAAAFHIGKRIMNIKL